MSPHGLLAPSGILSDQRIQDLDMLSVGFLRPPMMRIIEEVNPVANDVIQEPPINLHQALVSDRFEDECVDLIPGAEVTRVIIEESSLP
jgi:hypothetical protein